MDFLTCARLAGMTAALSSALLMAMAGAGGCNSDQVFETPSETEGATSDLTKNPDPSLGMTTYLPPDLPRPPANLIPCRDIVECLGKCQLFPTDMIDQACVLGCVGVDGVTLAELLWGVDLALCAADVCSMELIGPGDTDEGETKCSPDEMLGIDLSDSCLACIVIKTVSTEPVEGCEEQFELCDEDPNNDAEPGSPPSSR